VSLGANLGDAAAALQDAVHALELHPRIDVLAGSPLYVTAPVGGVEQPDFHNAAVLVETSLPPRELLAVCQGIEVAAGRTREVRWGPRTLDLDLIAAHDARTGAAVTHDDAILTLPHPRAAERAFVLAPWADIDPDASLTTVAGPQPVRTLLDRLADAGGVRRTATPVRVPTGASDAGPAPGGDPV
jgi:dihydroneopterin aldolase/2-amino-4-hydroxy-6-hydroxymethyldihydropteridine diphosphokinase